MPHKVLAVDDNHPFTKVLKANLEKAGEFEVKVVNDPLEAVEAARHFQPDAIILDIIMPDLDGAEVMRLFQEDAELHSIPIVVLTAMLKGGKKRAAEPDSLDHDLSMLAKPVSTGVLVTALRRAISQRGLVQGAS